MNRIASALTFLLILLLPACAAPSLPIDAGLPRASDLTPADCTRHVSPDGDDTADGTADSPWASFQRAADAAAPGDVVCFQDGRYFIEETITIGQSGEESAPITFAAYPGETPILDGQGEVGGIIDVQQGASFLRISGFTLQGFNIWGLAVLGDNHDITLDHLAVSGGEGGIHFTVGVSGEPPEQGPVERVTLSDSVVSGALYTAVDCTPGPCNQMVFRHIEIYGAGTGGESFFGADGLAVERGQEITVEDCSVHDNGGDGIDLNSRDTEGNVAGVQVARCLVYNNHLQAIKLWSGGRMENNVIWGNGINPVVLGVYPGHYEVVNNTIAYNMYDPAFSARDYSFVAAYPETGQSAAITLVLLNNIFAFNTGPDVGTPTGLYLGEGVQIVNEGGNVFWSRYDCEIEANFAADRPDPCLTQEDFVRGRWAQITGISATVAVNDPLFAAGWPEADLHLLEGSPAIDRGVAEGAPDVDIEGNPRDDQPDSGAYEWSGP